MNSTSKSFQRDNNDEILNASTVFIDNLVGSGNDWKNIQDIVKTTIKALADSVRHQGNCIKDLERQLAAKANKVDLVNGLGLKANVNDVMRTFNEVAANIENRPTMEELQILIEDKVGRADLQFVLNTKPSIEEVKNMINCKTDFLNFREELESDFKAKLEDLNCSVLKKLQAYAQGKDIASIYQMLDQKANINEINEALASKASKDSVVTALQRKINKSEVDSIINSKVDLHEFQNLVSLIKTKADIEDLEKLDGLIDSKADRSDILQLNQLINTKVEFKDFEQLQTSLIEIRSTTNKKTADLDFDIDKLIDSVKKEFQSLNSIITEIDKTKVDYTEIEKLGRLIQKKPDQEIFNSISTQVKSNMNDALHIMKNEVLSVKKSVEEKLNEKLNTSERLLDKFYEEVTSKLKSLQDDLIKVTSEMPEQSSKTSLLLNQQKKEVFLEINQSKEEVNRLKGEVQDLYNRKSDRKDFELVHSKVLQDLESKVSLQHLDNLYKTLMKEVAEKSEDSRQILNKTLKLFENDIIKLIDKKANQFDLNNLLAAKADVMAVNNTLQNKASSSDLEKVRVAVERLIKDVLNKIDFSKFEVFLKENRKQVEEIQKDILSRATIKEMINLMKNKADIDDVNKALTQIHDELDLKSNVEQVYF